MVRRSDFDDFRLRSHRSAFIASLAADPSLDVTVWCTDFARSLTGPLDIEEGSGRLRRMLGVPPEVGVNSLRAWTLKPEFLVTCLAVKWMAGPTAARPQAVVGFGVETEGYLAGALGRVLGVPAAVAASEDALRKGWTRRARQLVRWNVLVMAGSEAVAARWAQRGVRALFTNGPTEEARWGRLGQALTRRLLRPGQA